MLDGPEFVDPVACIFWFRFRLMRRYLTYRLPEAARIGRLVELVSGGAPGHGPVHLLVESASGLGFQWYLDGFCWNRPGLPQLPMVEGPYQHFQNSILDALSNLNAADLVTRFGIFEDPCSSLTLPMFGTETRHCFKRSFLGVFGMVFSLVIREEKTFLVVCVEPRWGWSFVLGMFLLPSSCCSGES